MMRSNYELKDAKPNDLVLVELNEEQIALAKVANGPDLRITHALLCGEYGQIFGTEVKCRKYYSSWELTFSRLFHRVYEVDAYPINRYESTFNLVLLLVAADDRLELRRQDKELTDTVSYSNRRLEQRSRAGTVCPSCNIEAGASLFCHVCDAYLPSVDDGLKASIPRRIGANLLDGFVFLSLLLVLASFAVCIGVNFANFYRDYGFVTTFSLVVLGGTSIYLIFSLWLLARGQTPGKWLMDIRAVDKRNGSEPGLGRMIVRESLGKWVSGCFLGLGWFWVIWDRDGQTWHDKIAGTVVLYQRTESRKLLFVSFLFAALVLSAVFARTSFISALEDAQWHRSTSATTSTFRDSETLPHPTHTLTAAYTEKALRNHIEGAVVINLRVSPEGDPYNIRVVRSLGYGLDENAVNAVKSSGFIPAMSGGVFVDHDESISFNFRLPDAPSAPSPAPIEKPPSSGSEDTTSQSGAAINAQRTSTMTPSDFAARFGWYVEIIKRTVAQNWYSQLADPVASMGHSVVVSFVVNRDGSISDPRIVQSSGVPSLDLSAIQAVERVKGLGPLPVGYSGDSASVSYTFTYDQNTTSAKLQQK